jgi:uncharacterized protein YuzE
MRIGYDSEGDVLFIEIRPLQDSQGAIEMAPGAYVDLGANGAVLHVEVTNASKKYPAEWLKSLTVRPDQPISLAEAATIANVSPQAIRKAIERGRLDGRKIGRNWTTTTAALTTYLNSRAHEGPGSAQGAVAERTRQASTKASRPL